MLAAPGLLGLAVALVAFLAAAPAAGFVVSNSPPANRMPMTLSVGTSPFVGLDGQRVTFNGEAVRALQAWNGVGVGPLEDREFFSFAASPVLPRCDPDGVNVVAFSTTNCGLGFGDAVGVSHLWLTGGKVIQADVVFNQNLRWDAYAGPLRTQFGGAVIYDFYRVALHEFGHLVGLDHVPDSTVSIMRANVNDIDNLQPDDVAGARAVPFSPFGAAPLLSVAPGAANFGVARAAGGFADRTFTVRNIGGAGLSGQVATAAPFACVAGCQYTLGIGATAVVTVRFLPPAVGAFQGAVTFGGGQGVNAAVSGTGVADPPAAFVTETFTSVLGRAATAPEAASWNAFLDANPNPAGAGAFLHALFDGAEYRARPITPWIHVYLLFLTALGRAPSAPELGPWTADVIGRLNAPALLFVTSQEFRNLAPALGPAAATGVVTRLFQEALRRAPSPDELAAWRDYLVATGDAHGFARAILDSVEYLAAPRSMEQHVVVMFRGLLARDPLPAEVAFFADLVSRQIIPIEDVFVGSPDAQARFQALFQ